MSATEGRAGAATAGAEPSAMRAAVILLHGRGSTAQDILSLAGPLSADGLAFFAPEAEGGAWYPYSFLEPIEKNEKGIARGFAAIDGLVAYLAERGLSSRRIFFGGFSQGACLCLDYVARHADSYAGVFGLSGGLIGPALNARDYSGSLAGVPLLLGCSDADPYIPKERVLETADVMQRLGALVTTRLYPRAPHAVNDDEIGLVHDMIRARI